MSKRKKVKSYEHSGAMINNGSWFFESEKIRLRKKDLHKQMIERERIRGR